MTMEFSQLKDDKFVQDWLSGIAARPNTKSIYTDCMRAYTEYVKKTPEELILESEDEIRSGKLMRERAIFSHLRDFRSHLEASGAAPMSVKGRVSAVRSFYKYYQIPIPALPRSETKARPQIERREIPTKDDIRDVLKVADPMEKAIVLVAVASGLSISDISNLKVRDFTDGYDPSTGVTTLHIIRQKTKYEFYTFLTPESSQAVLDYLDFRARVSEKKDDVRQEQLQKQKVELGKDGKPMKNQYLFICRYITCEYLSEKDPRKREELRILEPRSIQKIYRELSERAQKASPAGEWNLVRSHNIRRYCNSTLLAAHASMFFVDYIVGHELDATHDAYYRATPKSLREEYIKYIPYLTIEKPLDVAASDDWKRIVKENETLKLETAKHVVERSELQDLRDEIERMKEGYHETVAEHIDEKAVIENDLRKEIDELRELVKALVGDVFESGEKKNKMPKW